MEQAFDESANGRTIALRPGQTFTIRLTENPTTGFRWQVVSAGAPSCTLVADRVEPPDPQIPGRPGHRTWTFRVEHAGAAVIELAARRPWDPGAPAASSFRLDVSAAE